MKMKIDIMNILKLIVINNVPEIKYILGYIAKTNGFIKPDEFAYDEEKPYSWFWLQDGVLLNDKFYSLPYVVSSDDTQPEGFKFRIEGINLIECDVKDNDIDSLLNDKKEKKHKIL